MKYKEGFFMMRVVKKMEQVSLRDYRFPIPGNIPCQFGQGSEQTDVAESTPAHGTGLE